MHSPNEDANAATESDLSELRYYSRLCMSVVSHATAAKPAMCHGINSLLNQCVGCIAGYACGFFFLKGLKSLDSNNWLTVHQWCSLEESIAGSKMPIKI